jgi:antitoxin (DNA-binding transcriptional repressor) of toxin-antitoxin stability system
MQPTKVGMREFRHRFGEYAEADKPVAVTKHGRTVGFYIPVRRKPAAEDIAAFREAAEALQRSMIEAGVTEDELVEEFDRVRKEKRRLRRAKADS